VSQDEVNYLRGQLKGLESIFLELMPFRVPLKRQDIQDFYEDCANSAIDSNTSQTKTDLRRQFNSRANEVRHLVDSAESLGKAGDRLNLILAASSLPCDRTMPLNPSVKKFCLLLLGEARVDNKLFDAMRNSGKLKAYEARLLLASTMFLITEDVEAETGTVPLFAVLQQLIDLVDDEHYLGVDDPFLIEARSLVKAMRG